MKNADTEASNQKNNLNKMLSTLSKVPTLKTVLNPENKFSAPVSSLGNMKSLSFDETEAPSEMSEEEAEAYSLLQALEDQNSEGSGLEVDSDSDDEYFDKKVGDGSGEDGVDPDLLKAVEKNLRKYKSKDNDTLFEKISKIYMREGLRRLVRKRKFKRKLKRLPGDRRTRK